MPDGSLPGVPVGINFGIGEAQQGFKTLQDLHVPGPYFNSEYWAGWFDFWGETYTAKDDAQQAADVEWTLRQGYSISIYMFHGGTTFGFMNGANSNRSGYRPYITSYDFNAALDESGRPTPKYFLLRDVIAKVTGATPPPVPPTADPISIASFLSPKQLLCGSVTRAHRVQSPASPWRMWTNPTATCCIAPSSQVPLSGDLVLDELHDYAQVYLDGKLAGKMDRRIQKNHTHLDVTTAKAQLDILVENTGRINFGLPLRGERKGITPQCHLGRPSGRRLADLLPSHEKRRTNSVPKSRLRGPVLLPGNFSGRADWRYLPRHQQLRQRHALAERTSHGPHLGYRTAENSVCSRTMAQTGRK